MECKYFGKCGSCNLTANYQAQLYFKYQNQQLRFADLYKKDMDLIRSEELAFRNRAEFRIYHKEGEISYAMNSIDKKPLPIDECPIVSATIAHMMPRLLDEVKKSDLLAKKLFGVEFLSSLKGDLLITMLYHKKLDSLWEEEGKKLQEKLDCKIIGRARKQKLVLSEDFIEEKLPINGKDYTMHYFEGGFTQPNQKVNIQMCEWVINNMRPGGDLCELYCGGGNFTIPLSLSFEKVLATEISKTSIRSAKLNCELNSVDNIKFIRMSSEEFVEARNKVRDFRRMAQENVELDDYNFSTIFVDPPRAGLDDTTRELCSKFEQVIYVSCNPETLHRDLMKLTKTHTIKNFALFDQFAYTKHIESGVILYKS
jgi:tRNA (uracil-5-)-methyltransferase